MPRGSTPTPIANFFVFLSLVSRDPRCPSPSGIASCASRLCRTHRRASIFVYFNYVTSGICAACEAFETFRASRDDRGCPCGSRSRNPLRPFGQGTCRGPPCACLEDRPHPRARVSQVRLLRRQGEGRLSISDIRRGWSLRMRRAFAWAACGNVTRGLRATRKARVWSRSRPKEST